MKVSEAVAQRSSIRAFLDTPVSDGLIKDLLEKSARAASGGNLQPWRVFVLNGESMERFMAALALMMVRSIKNMISTRQT